MVTSIVRLGRAVRSVGFLACFFVYLTCLLGPSQRLFVYPIIAMRPSRRHAIMRPWLMAAARTSIFLSRWVGGLRLSTRGVAIPPDSVIVVMNHQSILDIALGISLIPGPLPLIPTRDRYRRGIPGISPMSRLCEFPFVSQKRNITREEVAAIRRTAERVAAGTHSVLIFPEGHRTRKGNIQPFMRTGLSLILREARRPVYCIVSDGLWHARTFADAAFRFAGSSVEATVIGPYHLTDGTDIESFIDRLRDDMIAALEELRAASVVSQPPSRVSRTG